METKIEKTNRLTKELTDIGAETWGIISPSGDESFDELCDEIETASEEVIDSFDMGMEYLSQRNEDITNAIMEGYKRIVDIAIYYLEQELRDFAIKYIQS